jgi:hypothetical protein
VTGGVTGGVIGGVTGVDGAPPESAGEVEPLPLWAPPHADKAIASGTISTVAARPARRRDDFFQVFMCQNSRHFFLIEPIAARRGLLCVFEPVIASNPRHTCSPADHRQQFAYQFIASGVFVFELTLLGSISLQLRWALLAMAMLGPNFVVPSTGACPLAARR